MNKFNSTNETIFNVLRIKLDVNSKESYEINRTAGMVVLLDQHKIPVSALKLIFKSCNKLCASCIKHRVTVIPPNKSYNKKEEKKR